MSVVTRAIDDENETRGAGCERAQLKPTGRIGYDGFLGVALQHLDGNGLRRIDPSDEVTLLPTGRAHMEDDTQSLGPKADHVGRRVIARADQSSRAFDQPEQLVVGIDVVQSDSGDDSRGKSGRWRVDGIP